MPTITQTAQTLLHAWKLFEDPFAVEYFIRIDLAKHPSHAEMWSRTLDAIDEIRAARFGG